MNDHNASSHAIVKALKGPTDPPTPDGPSKIEIACRAWKSQDVYFPGRSEVLVDWILNSFLRKSKSDTDDALLSSEYWHLLYEILIDAKSKPGSNTWLASILGRVSFGVVTQNLSRSFEKALSLGSEKLSEILECFEILWPLTCRRMSVDSLADCFGVVVTSLSSGGMHVMIQNSQISAISSAIAKSHRLSLANSTSKKKLILNFHTNLLSSWMKLMEPLCHEDGRLEKDEIYLTGIDIVFSVDSLKSSGALQSIMNSLTYQTLALLPFLYNSYLTSILRHRSTLFGTSSSHNSEQAARNSLTDAVMESFTLVHKVTQTHETHPESWAYLLRAISVYEEANLAGNKGNKEFENVSARALNILTSGPTEHSAQTIEAALKILLLVARIDFDIIVSLEPLLFSSLSKIASDANPTATELLAALIGFHSKTRTLPSYVNVVLDCLSLQGVEERETRPHKFVYQSMLASPLLDREHLQELSSALRSFSTPGQIPSLTKDTLSIVQNLFMSLSLNDDMDIDDAEPPGKKKKRRREEMGYKRLRAAVSFAASARVAAVVISSPPLETLTKVDQDYVTCLVMNAKDGFVKDAQSWGWKQDALVEMSNQLIAAASLRLLHAVSSTYKRGKGVNTDEEEAGPSKNLLKQVQDKSVSAEYVIENLRRLFDLFELDCSRNSAMAEEAIEVTLHLMEQGLADSRDRERGWDGRSFTVDLSEDSFEGSVAVWSLALRRWLHIIDEVASESQLDVFVNTLLRGLSLDRASKSTHRLTIVSELRRAQNCGLFWEMHNIKDSFVRAINGALEALDKHSISKLLKSLSTKDKPRSLAVPLKTITSVFSFLLQAPSDYITRSLRQTLVTRGIAADILMFESSNAFDDDVLKKARLVVRRWIRLNMDSVTAVELDWVAFVAFIGESIVLHRSHLDQSLEEETVKLAVEIFRLILRSTGEGNESQKKLFQHISSLIEQASPANISDELVCRFFECVTGEKRPNKSLSGELAHKLDQVHRRAAERALPQINLVKDDSTVLHLRTLRASLTVGKYLKSTYVADLASSQDFVTKITSAIRRRDLKILIEAFRLIVELLSCEVSLATHRVDEIIAVYVHLFGNEADTTEVDDAIRKLSKSLSEDHFTHILALLKEALEGRLEKGTSSVIHLSRVISMNGPDGSSKKVHEFFQDIMQISLSNVTMLQLEPVLCRSLLDFVHSHCAERPLFLTSLDVGAVFLILSKVMSHSTTHSPSTHPEILHAVVGIASVIIRYRRDLVTSALPNLGAVLRLLIHSLRIPRPELGMKQTKQIADSLPWWISLSPSTQPLDVTEARAVARLLTALQTKTIPSVLMHGSNEQKAESLARPFSKHAPYVLTAYIDAMNDPLCSIPLAMRKELEPGLFALCDVMTEHGRDAIMVSALDSGGKATLKTLWRVYEKQRYVGKG